MRGGRVVELPGGREHAAIPCRSSKGRQLSSCGRVVVIACVGLLRDGGVARRQLEAWLCWLLGPCRERADDEIPGGADTGQLLRRTLFPVALFSHRRRGRRSRRGSRRRLRALRA